MFHESFDSVVAKKSLAFQDIFGLNWIWITNSDGTVLIPESEFESKIGNLSIVNIQPTTTVIGIGIEIKAGGTCPPPLITNLCEKSNMLHERLPLE